MPARTVFACLFLVSLAACAQEMHGGEPADASHAASAAAEVAPVIGGTDLSRPVRAVGTEPFWSLQVSDTDILFERPDAAPVHFTPRGFHSVADHAELRSGDLNLIVKPGPCSDGMSDRSYPLTVELRVGDVVYEGCASAANG